MGKIEIVARAKAFSSEGTRNHRFYVDLTDNTIRVWDQVAGYYTTCHCLSASARRRIVKLARIYASDGDSRRAVMASKSNYKVVTTAENTGLDLAVFESRHDADLAMKLASSHFDATFCIAETKDKANTTYAEWIAEGW